MAANFSRITRFNATIFDGRTMIIPGNARRRVISFYLASGAGALFLDVQENPIDLKCMFVVESDPFFLRLSYADWGDLPCYPWYMISGGVPMNVVIYESMLL